MSPSDLARRSPTTRLTRARRLARVAVRTIRVRGFGRLLRETDGAIFAEYTTLLMMVTLGAAGATLTLGLPLLRFYRYVQMIIAVPFP